MKVCKGDNDMNETEKMVLIDKLLTHMAEDVRELIKVIEDSPLTAKNHYDRYYSILSKSEDKNKTILMGLAMIRAGANPDGVRSAVKILYPEVKEMMI